MEWFHIAQLSAFGIAAFLARKTPHAGVWVACLTASYLISIFYLHWAPEGGLWPPQPVIVLFCDGAVLLVLREFHKDKWEWRWLGYIQIAACTLDLSQLFGVLIGFPAPLPGEVYGGGLEFLNYLAAVVIGGVGMMGEPDDDDQPVLAPGVYSILSVARAYARSPSTAPQTLRQW